MNPKILLPWLVIAFPLGWGVYQSILKSLPLFGVQTAAAVAPARPVTPTGNATAAPTPATAAPAPTPERTATTAPNAAPSATP